MKIRKSCLLVLFLAALGSICSFAEESSEDFLPNYSAIGADFVKSFTGSDADMLGKSGIGIDLTNVGIAVYHGNYDQAWQKTKDIVVDQSLGAIPIIGQINSFANLGKALGERTLKYFYDQTFENIYSAFTDPSNKFYGRFFSDIDKLPDSFDKLDNDTKTLLDLPLRKITVYLTETQNISLPEAEKYAYRALIAKRDFEKLCDQYGIPSEERSLENLEREIKNKMFAAIEKAKEEEKKRQEKNGFDWTTKTGFLELNGEKICDLTLEVSSKKEIIGTMKCSNLSPKLNCLFDPVNSFISCDWREKTKAKGTVTTYMTGAMDGTNKPTLIETEIDMEISGNLNGFYKGNKFSGTFSSKDSLSGDIEKGAWKAE